MDGLTKIITKIQEDNKAECQRIIAEANQKAAELCENAKKDGEAQCEKIISDAKAKALLIDAKAKSGADLEYKRCILEAKCELLDKMISDSVEYLSALDEKSYFDVVEKLLLAYALDGNGEMSLSEDDAKRIPDTFAESINKKLGNGKSITVSKKNVKTKGGFVLVYPEMRVDCTFESLIDDVSDDIKDELSRILFA